MAPPPRPPSHPLRAPQLLEGCSGPLTEPQGFYRKPVPPAGTPSRTLCPQALPTLPRRKSSSLPSPPGRPGRLHRAGQPQSPRAGVWVGRRKAGPESGCAKGADCIHTGLHPSYRASDHRRGSTLLPHQTQSQRDCHKSFLKQKANAGNTPT